ncbi:MAG: hypothetical protein HY363_00425 [Candidatus Aenigmarchaeota archaeon]|nr:hypothetical protein [Candidatus Aenigmarchaeota archaeon]
MTNELDVRRTVKLNRIVTGAQIVDALKTVASQRGKYMEKLLLDDDGIQTYKIGIASSIDVAIKPADGSMGIILQHPYDTIKVCTDSWPGIKTCVGYYDHQIIEVVEKVRDGLEKVLQQK